MPEYSTISFLVGYKQKDGSKSRFDSKTKIKSKGVKKFFNSQHHMIDLSGFERVYLDYLCEIMDEKTNVVHINIQSKKEFLSQLKTNTGKSKGLELVKKAVDSLKINNILIQFSERGTYVVNPRYFYKSSESNRKEIIKEYIEWMFGNSMESQSNFREAFGISEKVANSAKQLIRIRK